MSLNLKTLDGYRTLASLGGCDISGKNLQIYSENETMVGYYDNKPLYRKIISGVTPSSANGVTYISIPNGIENITNMFLKYYTTDAAKLMYVLSYYRDSSYNAYMRTDIKNNKIEIHFCDGLTDSDHFNAPISGFIEYTKVVDIEVSDTNTYSFEEKMIGETWVDGKPIYRRCFETGSLPNVGILNISVSPNIDAIVRLSGFIQSTRDIEQKRIIPFIGEPNDLNHIRIDHVENGKCRIITFTDWSFYYGYLILEYTKTTD